MKGLLLLSGGIDSPVAGYLMKKKMDLEAVYFDNYPFSGNENLERTKDNARAIGLKKLHVVPHGHVLTEYLKNADRKFQCVFCRRMMLRVSEALAREINAECLVTGENLAQVASQTLQNLNTEFQVIKTPIVRPLIGFDKNEIIDIAKKIGTYNISTRPVSCCSAVPPKPATVSSEARLNAEEAKIDVSALIGKSLKEKKELNL